MHSTCSQLTNYLPLKQRPPQLLPFPTPMPLLAVFRVIGQSCHSRKIHTSSCSESLPSMFFYIILLFPPLFYVYIHHTTLRIWQLSVGSPHSFSPGVPICYLNLAPPDIWLTLCEMSVTVSVLVFQRQQRQIYFSLVQYTACPGSTKISNSGGFSPFQ